MREELNAIWGQMRSDFEAVMLGFSVQRKTTDRQTVILQQMGEAVRRHGEAIAEQGRAITEQSRMVAEQSEAIEQQGQAISRWQTGMDRLMETVTGYYLDHEQRLTALEKRLSA